MRGQQKLLYLLIYINCYFLIKNVEKDKSLPLKLSHDFSILSKATKMLHYFGSRINSYEFLYILIK